MNKTIQTIDGKQLINYVVEPAKENTECGQCSRPAVVSMVLHFAPDDKLTLNFCRGHAVILSGYIQYQLKAGR